MTFHGGLHVVPHFPWNISPVYQLVFFPLLSHQKLPLFFFSDSIFHVWKPQEKKAFFFSTCLVTNCCKRSRRRKNKKCGAIGAFYTLVYRNTRCLLAGWECQKCFVSGSNESALFRIVPNWADLCNLRSLSFFFSQRKLTLPFRLPYLL